MTAAPATVARGRTRTVLAHVADDYTAPLALVGLAGAVRCAWTGHWPAAVILAALFVMALLVADSHWRHPDTPYLPDTEGADS